MEQVFYQTHRRLVSATCYILPNSFYRRLVEIFALIAALTSLFTLFYLHRTFVSFYNNKPNCLEELFHNQANNDIFIHEDAYVMIRINITSKKTVNDLSFGQINQLIGNEDNIDRLFHYNLTNTSTLTYDNIKSTNTWNETVWMDLLVDISCESKQTCRRDQRLGLGLGLGQYIRKTFSKEGLYIYAMEEDLILPLKNGNYQHPKRKIVMYDVIVSKDHSCLGGSSFIAKLLTSYLTGYDTVVINWAIAVFGTRGYMYNILTQELYSLNYALDFLSLPRLHRPTNPDKPDQYLPWLYDKIWSNFCILFMTWALFFTTSTIVSFMLRETQSRMLKFTFLLQLHVSNRIPYAVLIFTHLMETLVFVPIMIGIVFLMVQFFKDQFVRFSFIFLFENQFFCS